MSKQYFGTDGVRGRVGEPPITPELVLRLGYAAGRVFAVAFDAASRRNAGSADRQGHPHLRLPARSGAGVRPLRRGRRRLSVGTAADASGRIPHACTAPVGGHRHQRLAQSVRGQRHQVLLRVGHQAAGRDRTGDRAGHERADRLRAVGRARQGVPRQRRGGSLHRILQGRLSQRARSQGIEDRRRLRTRCRLSRRAACVPRARRRSDRHRQRARRTQHQRRRRRDASGNTCRRRSSSTAPISASRSTATATAW